MDGGGGGAAGHDAARGVLQATTLGAYLSSKPPSAVLTLSTGQSAGQALRALAAANVLSAPLFDVGRCARARAHRALRWRPRCISAAAAGAAAALLHQRPCHCQRASPVRPGRRLPATPAALRAALSG